MSAEATRRVRTAVVGCGRIAHSHIKGILAEPAFGTLVAVQDLDLQRAQQVAAQYGTTALDSLEAVMARDDIDAILLCTPNELHASQSMQALRAGKHVLVEKPMAEHGADADEMARVAEAANRVLAIGHTFRHSPAVRHIQDHLQEFGVLRAVEVSQCVFWDGPQAPWWATRSPEQGLILSLFAPHSLDFVQLIMRDDPLRVQVEAARHQSSWRGEDEAMILLGYPGRRMASVHISYNQRQVVDRKLLLFDKGVLRLEDGDRLLWNDEPLLGTEGSDRSAMRRMGGRDLSGYFRSQFVEFCRAVRGQPHRSVMHDEGRRLIHLIDRARTAARACADSVE